VQALRVGFSLRRGSKQAIDKPILIRTARRGNPTEQS